MNFTGPVMSDSNCGPLFNNFWDAQDISAYSGGITEPVTKEELKDYLRLEGFTDDDESPAEALSDFDFDDNLIDDILPAAREYIEEACGLSLIRKTIKAMVTNLVGGQEIRKGPVISITKLEDSNGDEILSTGYKVLGNQWKRLITPLQRDMTITYEAGYSTVPAAIKIDIVRLSAWLYVNRGDVDGAKEMALKLASKHSRNTWLV